MLFFLHNCLLYELHWMYGEFYFIFQMLITSSMYIVGFVIIIHCCAKIRPEKFHHFFCITGLFFWSLGNECQVGINKIYLIWSASIDKDGILGRVIRYHILITAIITHYWSRILKTWFCIWAPHLVWENWEEKVKRKKHVTK